MDDQNKNLILATALSFLVILVWFVVFPPPEPEAPLGDAPTAASTDLAAPTDGTATVPSTAPGSATTSAESTAAAAASDAPRVQSESDRVAGSISLQGGRIDELRLSDYRVTLDDGADIVQLLSPVGSAGA